MDNQNGGFIATYNRLGELTTFIGGIEDGSGKIASYDKNKVQYSIRSVADKDRKQNEELLNRLRENEIRTISRENDIYEAQELISENNDLIFSNYDELSAEIDIRIELFRKKLEEREDLIENAIDQYLKDDFEYFVYSTADILVPKTIFQSIEKIKKKKKLRKIFVR